MDRIRTMQRSILALGLAIAAMLCGQALGSARAAEPITRLRDVLDLSDAALSAKPPVQVRAVVTCIDKSYKMLFVQDSSAGVFLLEPPPRRDWSPGDELEIRGVAARGLYSPNLSADEITLVGKTLLPIPPRVSIGGIVSGALVSQRVEVEGIVQRSERDDDHLFLSLAEGENRCWIYMPNPDGKDPLNALDARVRVRGVVAGDFNKQKQLSGFQLFVNGPSDVEIIARAPTNAFQSPVRDIAELSRYAARRSGEHRVHVRGVVTLHWPGRATIVQDATGAVMIERSLGSKVKTGDEVNVAGFLGRVGADKRLRNAEARVVGPAKEPSAISAVLADAEQKDNLLVRVMARVIEWQSDRDGEVTVLLSSSNELFTAVMPAASAPRIGQAFPPGCMVSVVGVMKSFAQEARGKPGVALWSRGPSDLRLMSPAPAAFGKGLKIFGSAAAGLAFLGIIGIVVLAIRNRSVVTRMSARQNETEQRFEEMERQLRRSHRDREHIAQELHDNIIQSIYSVGLGIDEARRLTEKSPERVEQRLNVAVESLNAIIRDVRSFLVGLEPKGLEGHELKTALKSVLLTSGEDQQARFSIQIDANAARDLNTVQATEIFNIAKEAMSNSMRHAHAQLTTVSLVPRGRGVRLEVNDDGAGFNPAQAGNESLGLHNLSNRAHNIGAQLEIISAPGAGTRIVLDLPFST